MKWNSRQELTGLISLTGQGEEWTESVTAAMSLGFQNPCLLLALGRFQADRKRYIFVKCFKCWMWSLSWQCPFESLRSSVLDVQRNTFQTSAFQILSEQQKKVPVWICILHTVPQTQGISSSASDSVIPFGGGTFFFFFSFFSSHNCFPKKEEGERVYFQNSSLSFFIFIQSPLPTQNTLNSPLCNFN